MPFIGSLLGGAGLKILAGAAIVLTIAGVLLGVRNAGRNLERVESMQRNLENARVRRETDRAIHALTDVELDDGLRAPSARR